MKKRRKYCIYKNCIYKNLVYNYKRIIYKKLYINSHLYTVKCVLKYQHNI